MIDSTRIYGFPPVYDVNSTVLICGSMPSIASLDNSFYYAHPRNAFWPIISDIFNEPYPEDTHAKIDLLLRHRIALWDTIASCERMGSLDSAIRNPKVNDFSWLFRQSPHIKAILFNGGCAMDLYCKHVLKTDPKRVYIRMPSTSPAYTLSYEEKKLKWQKLLMEVIDNGSD